MKCILLAPFSFYCSNFDSFRVVSSKNRAACWYFKEHADCHLVTSRCLKPTTLRAKLIRHVSSLHCLKSLPSFGSPLTRNMITDWKQNFLVTKLLSEFVCLAFGLTPVFWRRTQTSKRKQTHKKSKTRKGKGQPCSGTFKVIVAE